MQNGECYYFFIYSSSFRIAGDFFLITFNLRINLFTSQTATQVSLTHALTRSKLTHVRPMFHFYAPPWKRQKTRVLLTFSGGIEMEHWPEILLKVQHNIPHIYVVFYLYLFACICQLRT